MPSDWVIPAVKFNMDSKTAVISAKAGRIGGGHDKFDDEFRMGMRMFQKKIILLLALVWIANSSAVVHGEITVYDHTIAVENMRFNWKLGSDVIHIQLSAKTDGWVGIGFNPTAEMKDANFVIGYVKEGKAKVTDHYGNTKRQHQLDEQLGGTDNIKDISGKEENGSTEIQFSIPLDSGDKNDRPIFADKKNTILLAYGAGSDSFRPKHAYKTVLQVDLQSGDYKQVK